MTGGSQSFFGWLERAAPARRLRREMRKVPAWLARIERCPGATLSIFCLAGIPKGSELGWNGCAEVCTTCIQSFTLREISDQNCWILSHLSSMLSCALGQIIAHTPSRDCERNHTGVRTSGAGRHQSDEY